VSFIHYDLHCKSTKRALFAVAVPNAPSSRTRDREKWRWRVAGFLTAEQIARRYGLPQHELPRSSRQSERFKAELFGAKRPITAQLVEDTQWDSVQQIKSLKRGQKVKAKRKRVEVAERAWKEAVVRSLDDEQLPTVPVVVNRGGAHWIEWVKMVRLEAMGGVLFVGVSCRDRGGGRWSVQSIDLDSGRIYNKYRLVGPPDADTRRKLKELSAASAAIGISEIEFVADTVTATHCQSAVNVLPFIDVSVDTEAAVPIPRGSNEQWIDQMVDDVLQNDRILNHNEHHLNVLQRAYKIDTAPPPMYHQENTMSSYSYSPQTPPTPQIAMSPQIAMRTNMVHNEQYQMGNTMGYGYGALTNQVVYAQTANGVQAGYLQPVAVPTNYIYSAYGHSYGPY